MNVDEWGRPMQTSKRDDWVLGIILAIAVLGFVFSCFVIGASL